MTESQQALPAQAAASQDAPSQTSTRWTSSGKTPLRQFLRTETGSATILAAATLAALIWSNVAAGSYERLWGTELTVGIGGHGLALDLRQFVNSGLMALFFLVVGLEARREWDMGELRVRSRLTLPFLGRTTPVMRTTYSLRSSWASLTTHCTRPVRSRRSTKARCSPCSRRLWIHPQRLTVRPSSPRLSSPQ